MPNLIRIQANFLNKKIERLRDSVEVFLAEFLQKMNFFQIFLHFWNQLDELIWKTVLFFSFDKFLISDKQKSIFRNK